MKSILLFALAFCLLGCTSSALSSNLSFSEVQTLNPGVSADWVLAEYPFGDATRDAQGRVTALRYSVEDAQGNSETLVLRFGPDGRLVEKQYSGRVLRPLEDS